MASWCLVCPVDIVTVVDLAAYVDHTKLKGRLGVVVVLHSIDEVCTVGMIWLCTSIKSILPLHIGMNMSVYTTNITKSIHTATFAQIVRTTPQD